MTRNREVWVWVAAGAMVAAAFGASAWVYPSLPATIPTHWNLQGQADGFGSKSWGLFLMPTLMVGLAGLFRALPALSPKGFQVESFRPTYLGIMLGCLALFGYIHGATLYATWAYTRGGGAFDIGRVLFAGMFLFLVGIGSVMGKVRRNFYIGVRVPWTLASDRVWDDTHRFASWTMVGGGALGLAAVLAGLSFFVSLAVMLVALLAPVVYSFAHYKHLEKTGAL